MSYENAPKETHRIAGKHSKIGIKSGQFRTLVWCLITTNFALCSPWLCQTSAPFSLPPTLSSTATCKHLLSKYRWPPELWFHIVQFDNMQGVLSGSVFFQSVFFQCVFSPKNVYFPKRYSHKVYFAKVYFCKVYPTCMSSKLCKVILLGPPQKIQSTKKLILVNINSSIK